MRIGSPQLAAGLYVLSGSINNHNRSMHLEQGYVTDGTRIVFDGKQDGDHRTFTGTWVSEARDLDEVTSLNLRGTFTMIKEEHDD